MLVYYRTYYTCIHNTHKNMAIHQETVEKLHNTVKGFRVGDIVTSKTVKAASPYVSCFVGRGYLVRVRRGVYRVLRAMTQEDASGVIDLYNLSQNKRRAYRPEAPKPSAAPSSDQSNRRSPADIVDAVYSKVKDLRNGSRVLINDLTKSPAQRKRLRKAKLVLRAHPHSLVAGCIWNGEGIAKDDLAAVLLGKRRPYKRRKQTTTKVIAKPNFRPLVDTALEALDNAMKPNGNGVHSPDAPLTIESNGFHITLNKGTITISR
jgi:hypothetical protein